MTKENFGWALAGAIMTSILMTLLFIAVDTVEAHEMSASPEPVAIEAPAIFLLSVDAYPVTYATGEKPTIQYVIRYVVDDKIVEIPIIGEEGRDRYLAWRGLKK